MKETFPLQFLTVKVVLDGVAEPLPPPPALLLFLPRKTVPKFPALLSNMTPFLTPEISKLVSTEKIDPFRASLTVGASGVDDEVGTVDKGEYPTELSQKITSPAPEILTVFPEIIPFSPQETFFENIRLEKSLRVSVSPAEMKA
ncbi:Uncharacterised protein [Chlamydia trachomatis]|nr:Uncharacterised protein [Chlamydia trachomatis]CRI74163.1 Uncharacterised protein [Chlamydia trachomatis]